MADIPAGDRRQLSPPASDAGALLFYVRPSHLQTFEAIVERLRGALAGSGEEVRRQQAVGWKMFRSRERTADAVVFVFLFDPVIWGANYDPVKLLARGHPVVERVLNVCGHLPPQARANRPPAVRHLLGPHPPQSCRRLPWQRPPDESMWWQAATRWVRLPRNTARTWTLWFA